jgi:hypothetical protein
MLSCETFLSQLVTLASLLTVRFWVGEGSPWVGKGSPWVGKGSPWVGKGSPWVGEGSPWVGKGSPWVGEGNSSSELATTVLSRFRRPGSW